MAMTCLTALTATTLAVSLLVGPGCQDDPPAGRPDRQADPAAVVVKSTQATPEHTRPPSKVPRRPRTYKLVHVFVALCDNRHQGIVPVPAALGNGQDPKNNLYWGAKYGVKTFFARSPHWTKIACRTKPDTSSILGRVVFKNKGNAPAVYVLADAYTETAAPTPKGVFGRSHR